MRKKIDHYLRLAFQDQESRVYHIVNDILAVIILISISLIAIESVESIKSGYSTFFNASEIIIMTIFTLEYLIYIYLAPKKRNYVLSFFGIADLLAILPTYLGLFFFPLFGLKSLRVLRIIRVIRLLRILRLLKLVAYTKRRHTEEKIYFKNLPWYNIELYVFSLVSVIIISGTLMHLIEGGVQFASIPQGLWWATVTLTTVGYGDVIPQTIQGKIFAAIVMIIGVMLFAMLINVVGKVMQKIILGTTGELSEDEK